MTSKISCFDRAVFRRALKKTAPVWILYTLYELLLPLRLFSFCRGVSSCTDDFLVQIEKTILGYARINASLLPFLLGGLLAVSGWHRLFLRRTARAARDAVSDELSDGRAAVRCARALVVAAFMGGGRRLRRSGVRARDAGLCRGDAGAFCCFSRLRCWSAASWGRWLRCLSYM